MRLFEFTQSKTLEKHRSNFVKIAQGVYDEWDENPDEYAGGGICHLIADAIADYLVDRDFEATTISDSIGEVHVWTAVNVPGEGIYRVDIPPYTYETGGGYNWQKVHDVEFDESDVIIDYIATEDEAENYFGDMY